MIPASSPAPPDVAAAFGAVHARFTAARLDLRWYDTVTSTMDVVEEAAQAGAPDGLVVVADEQTRGRGRRGNPWSSPPGAGLYVSFLWRPSPAQVAAPQLALVTLAAGVAVRSALAAACGLAPDLKWPNDLTVGRRKLAGILAEGLALGSDMQAVILGVGINLARAAHPPDVAARATSLEEELGAPVERGRVLEEVIVAMWATFDDVRQGRGEDIVSAWREAAAGVRGRVVAWQDRAGDHQGIVEGIDEAGALLVRVPSGIQRIVAGELRWL